MSKSTGFEEKLDESRGGRMRTVDGSKQPGSEWIVGGGEMGRLIRAMDWSHTPLGHIASWPQSLRTALNLCLASDLPICIIWGSELVQLYNDGYRLICGEKHPRSMGQNFPECWREAWPVIGAAHDSALAGNTAFLENQHVVLERHSYMEECFFTFSFSPIRDETGRLAGLFHPVIEMTPKILVALSMALHELATNAMKYGALSNEKGRVRIAWSVAPLNGSGELQLTWVEEGGPPVVPVRVRSNCEGGGSYE